MKPQNLKDFRESERQMYVFDVKEMFVQSIYSDNNLVFLNLYFASIEVYLLITK